ncbi:hypothetical protein Tco_1074398 [Tanacetum coccineum]
MVNVIPPGHVDDLPVVEPNLHEDVPVVLEPVLVDKDEDPKEEEFEKEEEPQKEEDDMEVDINEDENEPELTYPYEEVDPLTLCHLLLSQSLRMRLRLRTRDGLLPGLMRRDINSLFGQMASLSRRLCGREKARALVKKKVKAKDEYYGKLILDLGNEVRSSVEEGTAAMENLVRKLGNAEEKAECKKLKKELEEAREISIGLEFELMISIERWFVWDLCLKKDLMRLSMFRLKMRRVHHLSREDLLVILSTTVRRMIKESVDAAIAAKRARHANAGNDARGSGPVGGQDSAPDVRECTFAGFMKCNPIVFHGIEGAVELRRWFEKTESVFGISECIEGKKVKFDVATL